MSDRPFSAVDFVATRAPVLEGAMLPTATYTSKEFYDLEVEHIFRKEWFCVGREDQIPNAGDYLTLTMVGEPLVVVRDGEGVINVLSRVCRHRGALVAEGEGNTRSFECPYHAWTYSLQGKLIAAPYMEQTANFAKRECRLPSLPVETWEGFVFTTLDPNPTPLGPQLAPLSAKLANYRLRDMRAAKSLTFTGDFNWKVMLENNCEGYHHIGAHKETAEPFYPARFVRAEDGDGKDRFVFLTAAATESAFYSTSSPLPAIEGLAPEQLKKAVNPVVLPTHIMFIQWDLMTYFQMFPLGPEKTNFRLTLCLPKSTMQMPKFDEVLDGVWKTIEFVNDEDNRILTSAHDGLRSGLAEAGRYSYLDQGVWQFHQYVLDRLFPDAR